MELLSVFGECMDHFFLFRCPSIFWRIATLGRVFRIIGYFLFYAVLAFLIFFGIFIVGECFAFVFFSKELSFFPSFATAILYGFYFSLFLTFARTNALFNFPASPDELRKDFIKGRITKEEFIRYYPLVKKQMRAYKERLDKERAERKLQEVTSEERKVFFEEKKLSEEKKRKEELKDIVKSLNLN